MEATEVTSREQGIAPQMSVGSWVITFLILAIPLVNIIMMFIWAFDATSQRRNFARAYLIVFGIIFVLWIIVVIALMALGGFVGFFNFIQLN